MPRGQRSPEGEARRLAAMRTPEYRAKMARATKGNQNARGYQHTPEELAAIAAAAAAHWADPEHRALQTARRRKTDAGYEAAHDRVRKDRGRVREHSCITCGKPAAQWALNHERAKGRVRISTEKKYVGLLYSLDPADYDPRCVRCHKRYDLDRER